MKKFQTPFFTRTSKEMKLHSCSKFKNTKDHCCYLLDLKAKNNEGREQSLQKVLNNCDFNETSTFIYFCLPYIFILV